MFTVGETACHNQFIYIISIATITIRVISPEKNILTSDNNNAIVLYLYGSM